MRDSWQTDGVNIGGALKLSNELVDHTRLSCNDVHTTAEVFGWASFFFFFFGDRE